MQNDDDENDMNKKKTSQLNEQNFHKINSVLDEKKHNNHVA
jgi:hypothetical protein